MERTFNAVIETKTWRGRWSAPFVINKGYYQRGGVKFSMKTLQHVGHASTKWTLNGVALKRGTKGLNYGN